ncbi:MAG: MOSC domain-containing protein [Opitutaceae bacterium]|nr:MOSC domain-containing protein [Opitutaceae bacterium]
MRLISIQTGMPRTLGTPDAEDPMDREWTTGFFKTPVDGPVHAGPTGLVGDGQADTRVHGGPDKAINVYPLDHYAVWERELGVAFGFGAFGENFTTEGGVETEICIGDTFRIGTAVVQVSQPRQPCWKLARRWRIQELAALVEQTGRTGWYFRVLQSGEVSAPGEFELIERPFPTWTVAAANAVMHRRQGDLAAAQALASCPALSESWRSSLSRRTASQTPPSSNARLGA